MNLREHLEELKNEKVYVPFVEGILSAPLNPSKGPKNTTDHPPVHPTKVPEKGKIGDKEWKFFDLVARRFLATFMPDAETENTSVELEIKSEPFTATGQTILFAGWKAVYPFSELKETNCVERRSVVPVNQSEMPRKRSPCALLSIRFVEAHGRIPSGPKLLEQPSFKNYMSIIYFRYRVLNPIRRFAVIDSLEKHSKIVPADDGGTRTRNG